MFRYLFIFFMLLISCSSDKAYQATESEKPKAKKPLKSVQDSIFSQKCRFENLSKTCIYEITRNIKKRNLVFQYNDIQIIIKEKKSLQLIDSVYIKNLGYFTTLEEKCSEAVSYRTNQNTIKEIVDNYFGFFIVADFNFDQKDDFAFLNGLESTSGPYYDFYTQTKNSKFEKDLFLTDSIGFFPSSIDKKSKILTTEMTVGVWGASKIKYSFDIEKDSWIILSKELTDFTKK